MKSKLGCFCRVWYKVSVFSSTQKNKVTVSESDRFRKLPFLCDRKLPLPGSYCFFREKVTVFCLKVTVFVKSYRLLIKLPFYDKNFFSGMLFFDDF